VGMATNEVRFAEDWFDVFVPFGQVPVRVAIRADEFETA